jgi:hypothetical protein
MGNLGLLNGLAIYFPHQIRLRLGDRIVIPDGGYLANVVIQALKLGIKLQTLAP